ncbi:hypothetical protein PACTADRAFT_1628 [Pachysolen tannophilus NRRL Y-2460]|uniref:Uncharacterized protein n=1 Tax=Pachysolen tannophilus NRRL Y-2460 TaxID=669874 RepID=A0A1E4TZ76_PACTA|nr:hypothetical protein PACTADRAFT_1628 [Pachysolen tannophilus NRRL Y-2460]
MFPASKYSIVKEPSQITLDEFELKTDSIYNVEVSSPDLKQILSYGGSARTSFGFPNSCLDTALLSGTNPLNASTSIRDRKSSATGVFDSSIRISDLSDLYSITQMLNNDNVNDNDNGPDNNNNTSSSSGGGGDSSSRSSHDTSCNDIISFPPSNSANVQDSKKNGSNSVAEPRRKNNNSIYSSENDEDIDADAPVVAVAVEGPRKNKEAEAEAEAEEEEEVSKIYSDDEIFLQTKIETEDDNPMEGSSKIAQKLRTAYALDKIGYDREVDIYDISYPQYRESKIEETFEFPTNTERSIFKNSARRVYNRVRKLHDLIRGTQRKNITTDNSRLTTSLRLKNKKNHMKTNQNEEEISEQLETISNSNFELARSVSKSGSSIASVLYPEGFIIPVRKDPPRYSDVIDVIREKIPKTSGITSLRRSATFRGISGSRSIMGLAGARAPIQHSTLPSYISPTSPDLMSPNEFSEESFNSLGSSGLDMIRNSLDIPHTRNSIIDEFPQLEINEDHIEEKSSSLNDEISGNNSSPSNPSNSIISKKNLLINSCNSTPLSKLLHNSAVYPPTVEDSQQPSPQRNEAQSIRRSKSTYNDNASTDVGIERDEDLLRRPAASQHILNSTNAEILSSSLSSGTPTHANYNYIPLQEISGDERPFSPYGSPISSTVLNLNVEQQQAFGFNQSTISPELAVNFGNNSNNISRENVLSIPIEKKISQQDPDSPFTKNMDKRKEDILAMLGINRSTKNSPQIPGSLPESSSNSSQIRKYAIKESSNNLIDRMLNTSLTISPKTSNNSTSNTSNLATRVVLPLTAANNYQTDLSRNNSWLGTKNEEREESPVRAYYIASGSSSIGTASINDNNALVRVRSLQADVIQEEED